MNSGKTTLSPLMEFLPVTNSAATSPPVMAWGTCDALYLLKAAAEEAQSPDTDKLIKALEKI